MNSRDARSLEASFAELFDKELSAPPGFNVKRVNVTARVKNLPMISDSTALLKNRVKASPS